MNDACLDENAVAELLSGAMTAEGRGRAERHLDGCGNCRTLVADLAGLADDDEATRIRPVPPPLPDEVPPIVAGQKIDHFEVIELVGHGGMGDVYAAHDTKLGRKVALKMVRSQLLSSSDTLARFQREAQATARFNHPNIVTIHFVGEHDGRPYVALEYLDGKTLGQRLREDPHPTYEESIRIVLAIAEGLAEAHRHGVLHRDLKPGNVHIDESGRVRVLDFGLAKFIAGEESTHNPLGPERQASSDVFETRATSTAGTPTHMAPEQWRGHASSEATDVWAVGVILFQLLSGRRPFEADTVKSLARAVIAETPAPSLGAYVDDASPALVELVARCLDKQPRRRPTASEVIEVLRGIDRTSARPDRKGARVATAVGAALALGAVATVLFLDPFRERSAPAEDEAAIEAEADVEVEAEAEPEAVEPAPAKAAVVAPTADVEVEAPAGEELEPPPAAEPEAPRSRREGGRRKGKSRQGGVKRNKDALFGTRE